MRIKRTAIIILTVFLISASACTKPQQTILLGDWINLIAEQAGIGSSESDRPYFLNVTEESPYYESVQACTDWGVLHEDQSFDPQQELDRRWTAATLIRLMEIEIQRADSSIKDINGDSFAPEISTAVSKGLMHTDKRKLFHPESLIDRKEAEELLKQTVAFINNPVIEENKNEVKLADGGKLLAEKLRSIQPDNHSAIFSEDADLNKGDIFMDGEGNFYQIDEVQSDGHTVTFHDTNLWDEVEEMELSGSEHLNFENAKVTIGSVPYAEDTSKTNIAGDFIHPRQTTIKKGDYDIKVIWSADNLSAKVSRKMPNGTNIYASASLNGFDVKYKFFKKHDSEQKSFFKVNFNASESMGANRSFEKEILKIKDADPKDFVNLLKSLFNEKKDEEAASIEVCSVDVPISASQLVKVNISVLLNLYVNGKAELVFTQNGEAGLDIQNGLPRAIKTVNHTCQAGLQADTGFGAEVNCSVNLGKAALADVGIEPGLKGKAATTLHLYDKEGKKSSEEVNVSSDFAQQAVQKNKNVLMCVDINAYKSLVIKLNSRRSMLGKMGAGKTFDLLNIDNNSLIPELCGHYENGHRVKKCTRKDRYKVAENMDISSGKRIELSTYAMIVRPSQARTIQIASLPEGYSIDDLRFTSQDDSIVRVDRNGVITAIKSGSTIITVKTNDKLYEADCSILVPEK